VSGDPPTRGLIDTDIVTLLGRLDPEELPDELVISAVTLAELSAGPHHAPDPAERARPEGLRGPGRSCVRRPGDLAPLDPNLRRQKSRVAD